MNTDFKRVKEIFLAALEKESGPEREALLDEACGADESLRQQVQALIQRHEQADDLLEKPPFAAGAAGTLDEPTATERPGSVVGPYKLLQEIGEGGFGVVFMAEQTQPVRRKVALKVLKPGMDTRQVIAPFEAERQALAIMDHPNIAQVYDGRATPTGRPFFVFELVKGAPITEFCDQNHLAPRQRLELFKASLKPMPRDTDDSRPRRALRRPTHWSRAAEQWNDVGHAMPPACPVVRDAVR